MSIKKAVIPPKSQSVSVEAALEKFIAAAPGAPKATVPAAAPSAVGRSMKVGRPRVSDKKQPGETVQIALKMTQADLDLIDAAAAVQRLSRASFIRMAVFKFIE